MHLASGTRPNSCHVSKESASTRCCAANPNSRLESIYRGARVPSVSRVVISVNRPARAVVAKASSKDDVDVSQADNEAEYEDLQMNHESEVNDADSNQDTDLEFQDDETDEEDAKDDANDDDLGSSGTISEQEATTVEQLQRRLKFCESLDDLLDAVANQQEEGGVGVLSFAKLRVIILRMRKVIKGNWVSRQSRQHAAWKLLEDSFHVHKQKFDLQTLLVTMRLLVRLGGNPPGMTQDALSCFELLSNEFRSAPEKLVTSYVSVFRGLPSFATPLQIRILHEKVVRDLPDYDADTLAYILIRLSYIQPYPPSGMVYVCWDRTEESLNSITVQGMKSLLQALCRVQPGPSARMNRAVFEKCIELAPEMDVTCMARVVQWLARNNMDNRDMLVEKLEPRIVEKIESSRTDAFMFFLESYVGMSFKNPTVIEALIDRLAEELTLLSARKLAVCLRSLRLVEDPKPSVIQRLADHAMDILYDADGRSLTSILFSVSNLDPAHPVTEKLAGVIGENPGLLGTEDAMKVTMSYSKLDVVPKDFLNRIPDIIDTENLWAIDGTMIATFLDALRRMKYRNQGFARSIAKTIHGRMDRMPLHRAVVAVKACVQINDPDTILFEPVRQLIVKELPNTEAYVLSAIIEMMGIIGKRDKEHDEILELTSEEIVKKANNLNGKEMSVIMRHMGRLNFKHDGVMLALSEAVKGEIDDMPAVSASWLLWGFAKLGFTLPKDVFLPFAAKLSKEVECLHLHDLCRFAFACGRWQYNDEKTLKSIGDHITQQSPENLMFPGTSILIGSFTRLEHRHDALLEWTSEQVPRIMSKANGRSLANFLLFFRKFDYKPSQAFLDSVIMVSRRNMANYRHFEVSVIASELVENGATLDKEYTAQLTEYVAECIAGFDVNSACAVVWALVKSGHRPSKDIIAKSCKIIIQNAGKADFHHVGNYLWACGRAGYQPTPLLEEMAGRVVRVAKHLNARAVASIVSGYSMCQFLSPDMVNKVKTEMQMRLEEFTPSQFSTFLWGLANLGYREPNFFFESAKVATLRVREMTSAEVFTTFWAFARAERQAPLFTAIALERLSEDVADLEPPQLVSLSWALCKMGEYRESIMDGLAAKVDQVADQFSAKGISTILWCFATLAYDPGQQLFNKLTSRIGQPGLERFPDWLSLTHTLWACARLGYPPQQGIINAGLEVLERPESGVSWKGGQKGEGGVNPQHLALCMWSLCLFGMYDCGLVEALAERANSDDILLGMKEEQKQQMGQCMLAAQMDGAPSPLSNWPPHYVSEAMASWRTVVRWNALDETSLFQRSVASILHGMCIPYEDKLVTEDRCMVLDVFVPFMDEEKQPEDCKGVALELYTEQHLTRNTQRVLGKVELRQRFLEERGYEVIPLLESEWNAAQSDVETLEKLLEDKLATAGVLPENYLDGLERDDALSPDGSTVRRVQVNEGDEGAFVDVLDDEQQDLDHWVSPDVLAESQKI